MDFFERQEQAQRNSARLAPLFSLAVIGVIPAVYLLALVIVTLTSGIFGFWSSAFVESQTDSRSQWQVTTLLWRPGLFAWVTGITLLIIFWSSARKIKQLAGGGRVVAELLGATWLNPATANHDERRLINVVEEMSIASGNPVPEIYILRREPGLNAFVAGHTANDMVVAVTEGCVKYLSREELQGIIAHEYSHLLHGDMAVNMRLMGLVHGLFSITLLSYWVMDQTYTSAEREVQTPALPPGPFRIFRDLFILVVGFILALIGFIGALCGRMVKSAVAREREFLADAAAVQFTRNPDGLASSLKKAQVWPEGTSIHSVHTEEASHIYFNDGMDEDRGTLTATHPPIAERIRRVEVMMGRTLTREMEAAEKNRADQSQEVPGGSAPPPMPVRTQVAPVAPAEAPPPPAPMAPQAFVASVGVPTGEHLQHASRLIGNLPAALAAAARDVADARALVCALLLSPVTDIRAAQFEIVRAKSDDAVLARMNALAPEIEKLKADGKIPLVELSIPALRQMPAADYEPFMQMIQQLIRADHRIDLFELALHKLLNRRLASAFKPVTPPEMRVHTLAAIRYDCSVLLSALTHAGQDSAGQAEAAFQQGARHFNTTAVEFKWMPAGDCSVNSIEAALNNIAKAGPRLKKQVLEACAQTVAADGLIQTDEAELLRAIADSLDCPIPPFASQAPAAVVAAV